MPVYVGRRAKYGAVRCSKHLPSHASLKECRRWEELCLLQQAKRISGLEQQVRIPLCHCKKRPLVYVADFTYVEDGHLIYEDCKGIQTPVFRLKLHLLADMGIHVRLT